VTRQDGFADLHTAGSVMSAAGSADHSTHVDPAGGSGFQALSCIVGGGLPPVLSPTLLATFGGWAVALMMGGLAIVSLVCVAALPETTGRTLSGEATPP
jgi:hypothetical protein